MQRFRALGLTEVIQQVAETLAYGSFICRRQGSQLSGVDAVSKIELGFPLDMFTKEMVRSLTSGGMRDQIDA